ncbi:hypothetical protein J2Z21_000562 [Streptomyces griseochromogenes]|uniref:Uncharacterized protein n=1 Tax=Streptomyces griseochromogenes TaxID=68214 RepID=A0A1B1B2E8_9ACTN|nr:hypothetical protein [Streptomyces griseochromogenes]ANP52984.1 hypothetical protein AVL59_28640 [Streptomyces griseochromogenes]MBP2047640.1 hypothetical protein [Streptomyces griseochromogenes]
MVGGGGRTGVGRYALGLAFAAVLFVLAAAVAIGALPRSRVATSEPRPVPHLDNRLEGTPS